MGSDHADNTHDPALSAASPAHHRATLRYWHRARTLTLALLLVWGGVTLGATWFARELDFSFFGWPLGYWAAAQGALLVYLLLIAIYAWVMDVLERAPGQPLDDAQTEAESAWAQGPAPSRGQPTQEA